MNERIFWVVLLVLVALVGFHARPAQSKPSPPQNLSANCVAAVPREWGEYVGSSSYGVVFKDSSGTLRFVAHFPRGFKTPPQVALEVQRN